MGAQEQRELDTYTNKRFWWVTFVIVCLCFWACIIAAVLS
jgi:hypothetical protein